MDIMQDFRKEIRNFEVRTWTTIFIVLKITHVISWNWIWVLCTLWIDLYLTIIVEIIKQHRKNKKQKTIFN